MAVVKPVSAGAPVLMKNQGVVFKTVAVADTDDLNLAATEWPPLTTVLTTPAVAITSLGTLTDGPIIGVRVKILVSNTNILRVPAALGNVDAVANLDATKDSPLELVWNGTDWQAS